MRAFAARWLTGDERTLGALLAIGVLIMAFFRLDRVRQIIGVAPGPDLALVLVLVTAALSWWSMLPRGFVWLDPAVLTWRDFTGNDRERVVARRLAGGWLARMLALGYLLALLAAVVGLSPQWVLAGAGALLATGLLALGATRRRRRDARTEALTVLALAAAVVALRPTPLVIVTAAALLVLPAGLLLTRSGRPGLPEVAKAGRNDLVQGWRDRVLRVVGVQFLDPAMLLPAARPVRAWSLRHPTGLRLAWVGVAGRARTLPAAALLALTAVAAHLALPALLDEFVFTLLGYLALVPLAGGLGELWRSPGRRRWLGHTDTALRAAYVLVLTALAAAWAVPAVGLAALAGISWDGTVPLTVPLMAACAVRTVTGDPPTYDNPAPVDTPMGSMPLRLIARTLRGPDIGLLALLFVPVSPVLVGAAIVAAAVAVAVLR
jgi:hypothetical protein